MTIGKGTILAVLMFVLLTIFSETFVAVPAYLSSLVLLFNLVLLTMVSENVVAAPAYLSRLVLLFAASCF